MNTLNTANTSSIIEHPCIGEIPKPNIYDIVLLSSFWKHKDNAEKGIKQVRELV